MSSRSSRSSPSFSDLLEEQFRKRRRSEKKEEEEEEEERERSRDDEEEEKEKKKENLFQNDQIILPMDIQLILIEETEKANRNVDIIPSSKLIEVSKIWRDLYNYWIIRKNKKLQYSLPNYNTMTLAMTRLFISPRFKLISSLQWSITHEILHLFLNSLKDESVSLTVRNSNLPDEFYPKVLYLFKFSDSDKWAIGLLNPYFYNMPSESKYDTSIIEDDNISIPSSMHFNANNTKYTTEEGYITFEKPNDFAVAFFKYPSYAIPNKRKIGIFLVYGRVYNIFNFRQVLSTSIMIKMYQLDTLRFEKPSNYMLSFKDTLIIAQIDSYYNYLEGISLYFEIEYYMDSAYDSIMEKQIYIKRNETIFEVISNLLKEFKNDGFNEEQFKKLDVEWPNHATMTIYDSKTGYIPKNPKEQFLLPYLQQEFSKMPEPALEKIMKYSKEWGYTGSIYIPDKLDYSSNVERSDLLMIPFPWYFALTKGFHDITLKFARFEFSIFKENAYMFKLDSNTILAHQPYEMIFLTHSMEEREVEQLALLQKRTIPKRATSQYLSKTQEKENSKDSSIVLL